MLHVSRLTSHVSRLTKSSYFTYVIYALVFSYTLILSRLLDHGGGHFIAVALLFIIIAKYKWIFNSALMLSTLLATLFSPCMVYGKINSDLVLNFLIADKSSVTEFITTLPVKLFVSVIFILFATIILIKSRNYILVRKKAYYCALITLVISHMFIYPPIRAYLKDEGRDKGEKFHLVDFLYKNTNFLIRDAVNIRIAYRDALIELDKQDRVLNATPEWNPQEVIDTGFDMYVVVIGESARRDALHAYGFGIENTPFLSNIPRIQFNNYIAVGGDTVTSLSNTLVLNYHINNNAGNNIVDLAKSAGFKTYWLSNQSEVGIYDSLVGGIGKKSDYSYFLNFSTTKNSVLDDNLLLTHITQALEDKSQDRKVIFVHLYGSHMHFCKRTQGSYDVFHVDKKLSCYVQSIKQTDALLKEIYSLLESHKQYNNKEWAMVYFSDHGLANNNSGQSILHGQKYKANYAVPFVILNSKLTETTFINAQRSGLNFFDFFSDFSGIKDALIFNECNFISEEACPNSATVIRADNKAEVDFFSLEDEKLNYFR